MNRIRAIDAPTRTADGELLARFLAVRDDYAFAELLHRHGAMVFGVCFRRLGQCQDAEDAFQAVFLALAERAPQLVERHSMGPWLYTVARRVSGKALRSRRRRRWVCWGSTPEPMTKPPVEMDVDLDAALASLTEQERSAIILCHLDGLLRAEAARALGVPEGTLSARLALGLEKLRRKLGKAPAGVLAASLMVAPPDPLSVETLHLVRHWREGTLDDWASPQTLDLFREELPMRLLSRIGPAFTAVVAAAFIMVGAGVGWRLMVAQEPPLDKPKSELPAKGNVAKEAASAGGLGGAGEMGGGSDAKKPVNGAEVLVAVGGNDGVLLDAVRQFNDSVKKKALPRF